MMEYVKYIIPQQFMQQLINTNSVSPKYFPITNA